MSDPLEAKRKLIRASEDRMEYFERQIQERPRLAGLWRYWYHWYRVRRADWITRAYVEQVRAWKRQLHTWELENSLEQHIKECDIIAKNLETIEDGLTVIETELKDTLELAREHEWRIRYPKPQTTMEGWISSIHDRYSIIRQWIQRIREELPGVWIDFVYVIYYAYTSPGAERHLEAHLESKCISTKQVKEKVKELANKILRAFVQAPRLVGGELKPGYTSPLLRADMAKPPYEGRITQGPNVWQWGVQWNAQINYLTADKRVVPSETEGRIIAPKTVRMIAELFDFDYAQLRSYKEAEVPSRWWQLTLDQLLDLLGIEVER